MSNLSQHIAELGRPPATFTITDAQRLQRFLILGSEGGTYYATERRLTVDNAETVKRLAQDDAKGLQAVRVVAEVSDAGRAPKNDAALLSLAVLIKFGTPAVRQSALEALPRVARIGTHLFHFLEYASALEIGWGRGFRRAIGNWYTAKGELQLARQLVKYQSRDGWSNRDALRLAHPRPLNEEQQALFHWAVKGEGEGKRAWNPKTNPGIAHVNAFEAIKKVTGIKEAAQLIQDFSLPREAVPTQFLNDVGIWEVLLQNMGVEAMVRNLGKMTSIDLLGTFSDAESKVINKLLSVDDLKAARMHPIKLLMALLTYKKGAGVKGSLSWTPNARIVEALEKAFYLSFGTIVPTNKRILKAIDVSGSMTSGYCAGAEGITPRVASALMAMVTARTEPKYCFMGFSAGFIPLDISPSMSLQEVVRYINSKPYSATDCALPMLWALNNRIPVDSFEVYTDSETNCHTMPPATALKRYQDQMGIDAKLVVVGMTSSNVSVADPNNSSTLDVAGFDTATPEIISDFIRG